MQVNKRIVLASRPQGAPAHDNFRLEEVPLEPLQDGQVRVRNLWLSLDPYMRGRMDEAKSYAQPQPLGETMIGGTVGEVVESRSPRFAVGDKVLGMFGWQLFGTSDGTGLKKVSDALPLSVYLGCVGMPGVTAWYGLNRIVAPRAGETVVVSAASGAVGSVVGQLAKRAGCRVVGIAGGVEKCAYVTDELGFDACVDYKAGPVAEQLRAATPDGIDGCFENVGGQGLDAVLARMNAHGRIAVCGLIAGYDGQAMPLQNFRSVLVNRLAIRGFIVSEHAAEWPQALAELSELVARRELRWRESIAEGLENAPEAFFGLLRGRNFGKQLVRLG
jgi:NADPH-dependent curcumin reductase CurA